MFTTIKSSSTCMQESDLLFCHQPRLAAMHNSNSSVSFAAARAATLLLNWHADAVSSRLPADTQCDARCLQGIQNTRVECHSMERPMVSLSTSVDTQLSAQLCESLMNARCRQACAEVASPYFILDVVLGELSLDPMPAWGQHLLRGRLCPYSKAPSHVTRRTSLYMCNKRAKANVGRQQEQSKIQVRSDRTAPHHSHCCLSCRLGAAVYAASATGLHL